MTPMLQAQIVDHTPPVALANGYGRFLLTSFLISEARQPPRTHLALVVGEPVDGVPIRIASACVTAEVFGCSRCDCGWQLDKALRTMVAEDAGLLTYHPDHEGRGAGLHDKIRSYAVMDRGLTSSDAFDVLEISREQRSFAPAAAIVRHFGIASVTLLTNNPLKVEAFRGYGIDVRRRSLAPTGEPGWRQYLESKVVEFGHTLDLPPQPPRTRPQRPPLIALCGIRGAGKTTQSRLLAQRMGSERSVLSTKQSTDWYKEHPTVPGMREHDSKGVIDSLARAEAALLGAADRLRHIREQVEPALERGQAVISDHWLYSTYVDFLARGLADLTWLEQIFGNAFEPDVTICLDVPSTQAAARIAWRADSLTSAEADPEFLEAARRIYLAQPWGRRPSYFVVDGTRDADVVADDIATLVDATLERS